MPDDAYFCHGRVDDMHLDNSLSTHDALIVAAALDCGCDVLLSKDMQHSMMVDGRLTIVDPFLGA